MDSHKTDQTDQKKKVRLQMLQLRNSLNIDDINSKSRILEDKLWSLIEDQDFRTVMFYIAFGSEVRTQDCIIRSLISGRTTIVPICARNPSDNSRSLIPLRLLDLQSEVAEGKFGVPEPKPEFKRPFPPEEIELVVVPGIAFDKRGYRIGYGAGYYDSFLVECSKALFVGIAYEMQIIPDAFPTAKDIPVHKIITEKYII